MNRLGNLPEPSTETSDGTDRQTDKPNALRVFKTALPRLACYRHVRSNEKQRFTTEAEKETDRNGDGPDCCNHYKQHNGAHPQYQVHRSYAPGLLLITSNPL
jgi:hypothetical protein